MALVVFLRGVNVGGHRTLRPSSLAEQLNHLGAVNIGAAGTLVIRRPVSRTRLREEVARLLPFGTTITICDGREIVSLPNRAPFAGQRAGPGVVRFVSVLFTRPRLVPSTPVMFPSSRSWLLKVLATDSRFVFGMYRRHMKVIGYLGKLDRLFGVPVTTRNWNTIEAITRVLEDNTDRAARRQPSPRRGRRLRRRS